MFAENRKTCPVCLALREGKNRVSRVAPLDTSNVNKQSIVIQVYIF